MNNSFIDITGQRFGRLTCIKPSMRHSSSQSEKMWICKCDCGNEITTRGSSLRNGSSKSCGCARIETLKNNTTHALSVDENGKCPRLYRIWKNMKSRCLNPNTPKFINHGGRGISICSEWVVDYMSFHNWAIGHGYQESLSLDREDNFGNYEPSNCRWSTQHQQNINKRDNHVVTFHGVTKTLIEWAKIIGINYSTLDNRLMQYHWTVEKAFTIPAGKRRRKVS